MSASSRPPSPSQSPPRSHATDSSERLRRSLAPELAEELAAVGADLAQPPNAAQWLDLLPRLSGLIRARSFGRDSVALSHELRTPLTVVMGASELLLETALSAEQRAAAESVHGAGQQLLRILNQVLEPPPQQQGHSVHPGSSFPAARLEGRALVVEDNEFNRVLILHALSGIGCEVDAVSNGMDALSKLSTRDYDVVLMDCHMPGIDGFDTTREMRRLERGRQRVPILAVSAGGAPEMRADCIAAGMDDFIAKPFTLATLRARVAYWIARGRDSQSAPSQAPVSVPVPSQDSREHLDLSRLEELAIEEGTARIAVELSEIFLDDIARRVQGFADAAQNRDMAACLFLAHAIKGACSNFGAVRMARLAEEGERRCKAGSLDDVPGLTQELAQELELVRSILDQYGLVAAPGAPAQPRLGGIDRTGR